MIARAAAAAALLTMTIGCEPQGQPDLKAVPAKVAVVLFDLSESAHSPVMEDLYKAAFGALLERMTHGDALVAGWITERSAGELQLPVNENLPSFDSGTDNSLIAKGLRRKADLALGERLDAVRSRVEALLADRSHKVMHTDIFGSMELAERVFRTYRQPRKLLVVMSDMIQDAEGINFARCDLSESGRRAIIQRLASDARIPNLSDVEVFVVGASSHDLKRAHDVREFWLEYFGAAHAHLRQERYGGPLIAFEP